MVWVLMMAVVSGVSFADSVRIAGWRAVDGISEAEAATRTEQAIENYLTVDEDGQICGVEDVWGLERDRDLIPDFPERGEVFAVTGYAKGPDPKCEQIENYDCRVVFNRPVKTAAWTVEHVACDAIFREPGE